MQNPPTSPGDRVRAVRFAVSKEGTVDEQGLIHDETGAVVSVDDNVIVPPGTLGTVDSADDMGTLHVVWDNGSRLGLLPGADEWEVVE